MLNKVNIRLIASETQLEKTKIKLMASGDFAKVKAEKFDPSLDVLNMEEDIVVINVLDLHRIYDFEVWLNKLATKVLECELTKKLLIYDPKMHILMSPIPYRTSITQAFFVSSEMEIIQRAIQTVVVKSLF